MLTEVQKHPDKLGDELPDIQKQIQAQVAALSPRAKEYVTTGADKASTNIGNSISVGLDGTDSFNREVKATAGIQEKFGKVPPGEYSGEFTPEFWRKDRSAYVVNVAAAYDDKWKALPTAPGKPNLSNLTQTYSGQLLQLSNLLKINTMLSGAIYHDNSQGIVYDFEPALGYFAHWPGTTKKHPVAPKKNYLVYLGVAAQGDIDSQYGSARTTYDEGVRTYFLWQWKPKNNTKESGVVIGSKQYDCHPREPDPGLSLHPLEGLAIANACKEIESYSANAPFSRHTFAFNFRGFLPPADPTVHGHASAMVSYDYKLSSKFSLSFSVLDSYYATVSPTYSHNSLVPSFSLKFTPPDKTGN